MTDLKDKAIDIKGNSYVLVKDRILAFNEMFPNGSIVTEIVSYEGKQVTVKATVTPDAGKENRIFTGYSQAREDDGYINKTSALENAETSAVGRALAMMGIGVIDSVASMDEVNKAENQTRQVAAQPTTTAPSEATQAVEAKLNSVHRDPGPAYQALADEYDDEGNNRLCDECGQPLKFREGVGSSGKPYKGWFCAERGHPVQWIR